MRRWLWLAWFGLHFSFILVGSTRETLSLVARGLTVIPAKLQGRAGRTESVAAGLLGENASARNPVRRAIVTYRHVAGIEVGYGYFAPTIPAAYKLVFELRYSDGRVDYALPRVRSRAGRLRMVGLLDEIGRTRSDALRERLIKLLAAASWREHPEATKIRAIFGAILLPSIEEFERGQKQSYQFLYAYDFSSAE